MYENTQHSKGIKAVKTSLDNFPIETMATKVITTFLSLVITLNKFVFNCKNYIQIKGCAMGTIVCRPMPIYLWVTLKENIHPVGLSLLYLRFSGIFFIQRGSKEQFIQNLKNS